MSKSVSIRSVWLPGGACGFVGEQCLANNQCQMSVTIGSLWLTGELVAPWSSNVSQTINIIVCYNRELVAPWGACGSMGEQCLTNNQYYLSVTIVFITLQTSPSAVSLPHHNLNSTTIHPFHNLNTFTSYPLHNFNTAQPTQHFIQW